METVIEYFAEDGSSIKFWGAILIVIIIVRCLEKFVTWCVDKLKKLYNIRRGIEVKDETIADQGARITKLETKVDEVVTALQETTKMIQTYNEQQKKVNTVLLRSDIYPIYQDCLKKRYILEKEKQNFRLAYDEYVNNGGNSYVVDEIAPFIHSLPVFLTDKEAQAALKK